MAADAQDRPRVSERQGLAGLLASVAGDHPDRPGLTDGETSLTWGAVAEAVRDGGGPATGALGRVLEVLGELGSGGVVRFGGTADVLSGRSDMGFAIERDGARAVLCHVSADAAHLGAALARREALTADDRVALAARPEDPGFWPVLAACLASGAQLDLSADLEAATTGWLLEPGAVADYRPTPGLARLHLRAGRAQLAEVAEALPGTRLVNGLTLPETFGLALTSDPRDPAATVVATCGRPLGGIEVMVVDPRTGMDVLLYETGEVWLRGTGVFQGYAGRPGAGFTDRFFRTGVLGHLDSEGRLVLPEVEKVALARGWSLPD
ncbi:AMP-binding protein [Roseivivax sp.]